MVSGDRRRSIGCRLRLSSTRFDPKLEYCLVFSRHAAILPTEAGKEVDTVKKERLLLLFDHQQWTCQITWWDCTKYVCMRLWLGYNAWFWIQPFTSCMLPSYKTCRFSTWQAGILFLDISSSSRLLVIKCRQKIAASHTWWPSACTEIKKTSAIAFNSLQLATIFPGASGY